MNDGPSSRRSLATSPSVCDTGLRWPGDFSSVQPFDYRTWFDYAPEHESAFDDLLAALRSSAEWVQADREVAIRPVRERA